MSMPPRDESVRQLAFDFAANLTDGLSLWREQQQEALRRLGAELGFPVGANCEVVLRSGLVLRGRLLLDEADFFPVARRDSAMLRIDNVNFSIGEIASCVRTE
jgi:hypothetical protein